MQKEQGRPKLQISDHAAVDKAVVIEHAGHVSLSPRELKQRRRPFQAPRDIPEFIGREEIIEQISVALGNHPNTPIVWVLSGMAGVGKTSVAIRAANKFSDRFPDGILYASLAGATSEAVDPADVLVRFLRDLGVSMNEMPADYESLATAYRTLIATKSILVVLDDAADIAQVNNLIPTSPQSAAFITSRRPLGALPGSQNILLDVWDVDQCTRFLEILLGPERVQQNLNEVHELANLCGRLPIALRVLGAQLKKKPLWPISRMIDRLRDEQRRLEVLRADDIEVKAVFSTAYESLGPEQARIFRILGIVPSPRFSIESIAKLANCDDYATEDFLEDLSDRHLVSPDEIPGKYKIHDLMRLFAREKAAAEDSPKSRDEAILRLLEWHFEMLESKGPSIPAWVRSERASLVSGVSIAGEHRWDELCWKTAAALAIHHQRNAEYNDWITCNSVGLISARRLGSRYGEAVMTGGLGQAHNLLNNLSHSRSLLEDSLKIFQELSLPGRCSQILWEIGKVAGKQWDVERATASLIESITISTKAAQVHGVRRGLHALGHLYSEIGRHEEALQCFEEELTLAMRDDGNDEQRGVAYQGMGSCLAESTKPESALGPYEKAIELARSGGARHSLRIRLTRKAGVLEKIGRLEEAKSAYEEALNIAREDRDTSSILWTLHNLADSLEKKGELQQSDDLYAEIMETPDLEEDSLALICTLHCWGDSHVRRSNWKRGEELLQKAEEAARRNGAEDQLIQITVCQSTLQKKKGEISAALTYAQDAVVMARAYGSAKVLAQCLNAAGSIQEEMNSNEEATTSREEQLRLELLMQQRKSASKTAKKLAGIHRKLGLIGKSDAYTAQSIELDRAEKEPS
uniref:ATP-binding protein n=1 Tax=Streptomyces sp. NRRL S-325 TaxID=1463899 RepID=UPI00131B390D|nr:tetratricopeptide repeat protein [Streptomyces sp. NRRL S-325]